MERGSRKWGCATGGSGNEEERLADDRIESVPEIATGESFCEGYSRLE